MKKFLFRADDLGYSQAVNFGIEKSIREGLIRNVGLMTNMQAAEHGFKLIKDLDIALGQHTNISSGRPITDPKKIPTLVDEIGMFKTSSIYNQSKEDIVKLDEVILEIEAQYQQFLKITGKKPAYFDGHAVNSLNFIKGLEIVAEKHDLLYSPIPSNLSEPIYIGASKVYLHLGSDIKSSPQACLYKAVENAYEGENICNMIIYHPGYLDAFIMRNSSLTTFRVYETEMLCDSKIKSYLEEKKIQLITYSDL